MLIALRQGTFRWWNLLPVVCGVFVTCLGLSVIAGWHAGIVELIQVRADYAPMQYNAAVCLFLLGGALLSATLDQTRIPLIAGVFVSAVGVATGLEYLLNVSWGIDTLLFGPHITVHTSSSGRMAPNTALCFVMSGVAVGLMGFSVRRGRPSGIAIILGALTCGLALVVTAGYLSGEQTVYSWGPFTRMAIHTALGLALVGVGIVAFSWPRPQATGTVDIDRASGVLITLSTFGVLLIVLLAAAIGLAPLYQQLRDAKQTQASERLRREVDGIERIWQRTAGLASQLDIAVSSEHRLDLNALPEDAQSVLRRAYARTSGWSAPGHAYLGLLQPRGARVLQVMHGDALTLVKPPTAVATAIVRGAEHATGMARESGEGKGPMLVFFAPVKNSSWVVVTSISASALYAQTNRQFFLVGFGVLLIALFGALGMVRFLRPLTTGIRGHSAELEKRVRAATANLQDRNEKLRRSNRDLEQFAYAVSHDLQAPLRGIDGFAGLLAQRHADNLNEQAQEYLGLIRDSVVRMGALIQGILLVSRVDTRVQPPEMVELETVVAQASEPLRFELEAAHARVQTSHLPAVCGDATQLTQLFQNLIDNALKFRDPDRPLRIFIDAVPAGGSIHCRVADNGRGIEADQRERVFEIFKRGADDSALPGSGVGLALCRKIVERHGGAIHVEDAPGGGAAFVFSLPRAEAPLPADGGAVPGQSAV